MKISFINLLCSSSCANDVGNVGGKGSVYRIQHTATLHFDSTYMILGMFGASPTYCRQRSFRSTRSLRILWSNTVIGSRAAEGARRRGGEDTNALVKNDGSQVSRISVVKNPPHDSTQVLLTRDADDE